MKDLTEGYCASIGYGSSAAVTPIFASRKKDRRSQGANFILFRFCHVSYYFSR